MNINRDRIIAHNIKRALEKRFPRHTRKMVAQALGISPETVKGWLDHKTLPSTYHLFELRALIGPIFWAECVEPAFKFKAQVIENDSKTLPTGKQWQTAKPQEKYIAVS